MSGEITTVFGPETRLKHVNEVALVGGIDRATFDTRDFGEVSIGRGYDERGNKNGGSYLLAQSRTSNFSIIIGPGGDQSAIVAYDFNNIYDSVPNVVEVRNQADMLLKQCNNVTRR